MNSNQNTSLSSSLLLKERWRKAFFVLFLLFPLLLNGQTALTWEQTLDLLSETEDVESVGWASTGALVGDLFVQKMDINAISKEDLEQLPFLSAQQIEDICEYVYRYAPLKTLDELSMVESIDARTRLLLQQFLVILPAEARQQTMPTWSQLAQYGKNELVGYAHVPFYNRAGDDDGYLGYKYRHWLRYTYNYSDRVKLALVGSQDAGEPFFAGKNPHGYDYYTFYLQLKKIGALRSLVVGRYRVRFGMGLVMNNNFSFGKLSTLETLGRQTSQLTGHTSRMEGTYMQGAAATVALTRYIDISAFASYRDIDATLTDDESGLRTLITTGYHRTDTEMSKKHNASQWAAGGNVSWSHMGATVGLTGVFTGYTKPLKPGDTMLYRSYSPEGKQFWNMGLNYGYTRGPLSFAGETATGDSHAIATIHSLSYELNSRLQLMALQRFYSYKFYSIYGQSYSDGGSTQNENGVYLGARWKPSNDLTVTGYSDIVYFPWTKYLVSEASRAWDNLLLATYDRGSVKLQARYRIRLSQRDNIDKTGLDNKTDQRARLSFTWQQQPWQVKTQLDMANSHFRDNSFGYMLSEQLAFRPGSWQVGGTVAYFHTKDYDSRVYLFEPGMIYTMNFPMFYGKGIHYALQAKGVVLKNLMASVKLSVADYFDRGSIASGLQQINASSMTEMEVQLRWNF